MPRKRPEGPWLAPSRHNAAIWEIRWYDAAARQQRRQSTGEEDRAKAEVRLAEFILERQRPRDAEEADVQIIALLSWYAAEHAGDIRSSDTAAAAIERIVEHFGDDTVADLTPEAFDRLFADWRGAGLSDGTISRYLSILRAALNHAWKRRRLRSVPFVPDIPKRQQAKTREARPLDVDELRKLVDAARRYTFAVPRVGRVHSDHVLRFIVLSLGTAARPEAVLDLSPFQVRWTDDLIDLNPHGRAQTKKRRPLVRMPRRLRPYLQAWRDEERFVTFQGAPIASIKTAWRTVVKDAEIEGAQPTPYAMRHTVGRWLRRQSVPEADVQGQLGHAWSGETETYAAYDPRWMERPAAAIDMLFEEVGLADTAALGRQTTGKLRD